MGKNIQLIILILFLVLNITKCYRETKNIPTHDSTSYVLVDQGVSKPENLSIVTISTTELNVTWNHPEGERPNYYLVKWVDDDSLNENVAGATYYVIGSLDPCTACNVSVVGVDSDDTESEPAQGTGKTNPTDSGEIVINGTLQTFEQKGSYNTYYDVCIGTLSEGLGSDEVVCCQMETDEGVPSEPHIADTQQEYLNAHITWKPPEQQNGIIVTYEIKWRYSSNEGGYVAKNGTELEAIFALDLCKTYELIVTAETSKGPGNESAPAYLIMENYVPANMVSCTKGPGGSVTVSWNTASSCTVSGFLVEYNWHSLWSEEQGSNSQNVGPSNMNLPVLEAQPYSQFGACVGVGNTLDEDSCCEIVTNQEVPGPSENMTCELITASVANISWIKPTEINGVLGDWLLKWRTAYDEPFNVTLDSETYNYVLHGLLHNADYKVMLQASTAAGFGEESICVFVTPPPPSGSNAGAIAGGIIGITLGIILIASVVYYVMKRKTNISGKIVDVKTMLSRRKRERDERAGKDEKSNSMSPAETNQENIPPSYFRRFPLNQ